MLHRSSLSLVAALALSIVGCAGPAPKVAIRELAATAPETERAAIARLMRISSTLQRSHYTFGDSVELLQNGDQTYPAMIAAIRGATTRIDMESYQFDTGAAAIFGPLLAQKAQAGVAVHLIYDAWGSMSENAALFQQLRQAGVQVVEYNPLGSATNPDRRDHRKLLVIDNQVAITGGVNITGVYLNQSNQSASDPDRMRWRDTDVLIRGPAVGEFEALFIKTWTAQKGPALPTPPPPPTTMQGGAVVEAIDGAPVDDHPVIYETLLSAITLAKRSVHLTTGFFAPPPELLHALRDAAGRGIDVELVTAGISDSEAAVEAGRSHYHELLEAGVKIYERQGAILHAKTAVVDGLWSVVGSSNLDWRSTSLNNEIDALIIDRDFGAKMEAMYRADIAQSRHITPEQWSKRGIGERADEWWARLIEQQL